MKPTINRKKIGLYLLLSYGISWLTATILYLSGMGLDGIASMAVVAVFYMGGPAVATFIIQKIIYKERFKECGWSFDKKAAKWLFITPLLFLAFITLAFMIVALLGNTQLVSEFGQINLSKNSFLEQLFSLMPGNADNAKLPNLPDIPPILLLIMMIFGGMLTGVTANLPFMFGEEFGWRGLLLKETRGLGFTHSSLFIGVVWGLWHLPLILMGHNYPHYPYWGIAMMCLFTVAISPLFSYVRLKSKTILGACMLHGMINANALLFLLFIVGGNELFASLVGVAGVLAAAIVSASIYIFDKPFVRNFRVKGNINPLMSCL